MSYLKITFAVLIVLIIAIAAVGLVKKTAPSSLPAIHRETAQEASQSPQVKNPQVTEQTGTISDLLTLSNPQKCSFSGSQISWVIYVGDGKIRFDAGPSSYSSTSSHMIADSQTTYLWTDSRFAIKFNKTNEATSSAIKNYIPALDQKYTYSCQDWTVDNSLFVIPSNVIFKALN
jgi:hypothetical protein